MSRKARKVRGVQQTRLIMCEGITDKRFAERLKQIFNKRGNGVSVRIDEAGGGGPKSAIMAAINHAGQFDKKYVFIDSDLPIPADALAAARRKDMLINMSKPLCLEGFLLRLLGKACEINDSKHAKLIFNQTYGLVNGVSQAWYEEYITHEHLIVIMNDQDHECYNTICQLSSTFELVD